MTLEFANLVNMEVMSCLVGDVCSLSAHIIVIYLAMSEWFSI